MTARFPEPTAAELRQARQMLREFEKPTTYASTHDAEITASYAGQWVAITAKGVIASSKSYEALDQQLAARRFKPGQLYVTYIWPAEQVLIL